MELDPKDYDIVRLLTKIKENNGVYPPELMLPRRQTYVRRVAEIGLGFGVSSALKTTVKSGGKAGNYSTTAGGLIEAALVVAIVAEVGAAAYIYRDQIAALIQSSTLQPRVEEITSLPATDFSPSFPELILTDPPEATTTPLPEETSSATPIPGVPSAAASASANDDIQNIQNNQNNQDIQSLSTPAPKENNGNQYGLTPKPDRTKDPGGNSNNNNNNDNNNNDKDKNKDKDK